MTDEFEELVRAAGRGVGTPSELPTYHDAWRRGRRRRVVKRGALAAAGALMLVVAFSADLGRLPGRDSVEVDDVASEAVGVPGGPDATAPVFEPTPTTPVPTTAPLGAPDLDIDSAEPRIEGDDDAPPAGGAPATDSDGDAGGDAGAIATPPPGSSTPPPAPTSAPAPNPPVAPAVPTPTVAPLAPGGPTPQATADPRIAAEPDQPGAPVPAETAPAAAPTAVRVTGDDPNPGDSSEVDGPDGGSTTPVPSPPTAAVTGKPADASIRLPSPNVAGARACDTDGDGVPDARCQLLVEYECTSVDQLRDGYVLADVDEDGVADWCIPDVTTGCDLDGDGRADQACLIRPVEENLTSTGP